MHAKITYRSLAILTALSMLVASGCSSGFGWPGTAWWKQTPSSSSLAAKNGQGYPPPPSAKYPTKSTGTAGMGSTNTAKGGYRPSHLSGTNNNVGAGFGTGQPDYPSTGVGDSNYDPSSFNSNASFNDPSADRGYYSLNPQNTPDSNLPTGGSGDSGDFAPKGGFDDGHRTADQRNEFGASDGIGGPPPSGATPWSTDPPASQNSSGGGFEYQPGGTSNGGAPWESGASGDAGSSFESQDSSFDAGISGSRNESDSTLPPSLSNQKGSFRPGSTNRQFDVSSANESLGAHRESYSSPSGQSGSRQVNYEEEISGNDFPIHIPPAGEAFRSGAMLDSHNNNPRF